MCTFCLDSHVVPQILCLKLNSRTRSGTKISALAFIPTRNDGQNCQFSIDTCCGEDGYGAPVEWY